MAMESKKEIYDLIPAQYYPKTILMKRDSDRKYLSEVIANSGIRYPAIVKPDIGMKAFAVDKVSNESELIDYSKKIARDFLVQELIQYPKEVGIFYVKLPGDKDGVITGIVSKEFMSVKGNGKDTIIQLITANPRSYFQLKRLKLKYGEDLNRVLQSGDEFILVPYGSHTMGAKFIDFSEKINTSLQKTMNDICKQIDGFYFGRLDIRYNTFDELIRGENFSIIEINGAGSEPTHIYDPRHSVLFAWKEIIRHWNLLYKVSRLNKNRGVAYLSYNEGKEMLRANSIMEAHLKLI